MKIQNYIEDNTISLNDKLIGTDSEGNNTRNYTLESISDLFGVTPKYKVFSALLTQSGGDDTQYQQSGLLTIGVTYYIDDNASNPDFTNVGAPNNNVGTYFVATGTTPNSWGEAGLAYNPGAPVVTILENTLGFNPYFRYDSVGIYYSENIDWQQYSINSIPVQTFINCGNSSANPQFTAKANYSYEESIFYINSFNNGIAADDVLSDSDGFYKTSIEIRVYN